MAAVHRLKPLCRTPHLMTCEVFMKASVIHEYGPPSVLKYEDFPDPVAGEGEVVVRASATSINPVDWKMRSGAAKERFPVEFPGILGRDVSGIVREVGPGVTGFEPGDRVMAFTVKTYAELVAVKAADLIKVPEGLDPIEAAAVPLVALTGDQLIRLAAKVEQGQTILVAGAAGGVGRAAVWTAKQLGANVIAGVRKRQLKEAEELGADHLLALDDKDAMTGLGFVDVVADTVGKEIGDTLIGKVRPDGIFATVVTPPPNGALHPTVHLNRIMTKPDAEALKRLAEEVAAGRFSIPIDRMVTLSQAAEAHSAAEKGGIGKILLLA